MWRPRVLARRIHLLCGFLTGAFLLVASLTGSALVFRHEIDALLHADLVRVEPGDRPLPLETAVAAAARAYPTERPSYLRLPRTPRESLEVGMAGDDPLEVYVDPYRGTVLGARRSSETLPNVLFALHTTLLAGHTGETIMGVVSLLLVLMVATGLFVWWPGIRGGARRLREAITVKRVRNWRRINFDLHRAVGFWAALFLLITAVTGASLVFHDAFMKGLNVVTGSPPRPAPPAVPARHGRVSLDRLIASADTALDGETTYLTLPAPGGGPVIVRKRAAGELHPNGRSFVYLDPATAEARAAELAPRSPAGTRAYNILYPLHIGRWGGLWSMIAYAVLGLAPVVLLGTGVVSWWNRSGRRRLRRRGAGAEGSTGRSAAPTNNSRKQNPSARGKRGLVVDAENPAASHGSMGRRPDSTGNTRAGQGYPGRRHESIHEPI